MNLMSYKLKQVLGKTPPISSILFKMYHQHKNDERILASIKMKLLKVVR